MSTFLKWVGGKAQILETVTTRFPTTMNTYIEPFVGGGSILFEVLTNDKYHIDNIEASDINPDLITCYNTIKNDVENLIIKLADLVTKWKGIPTAKVVLPEGVNRIKPAVHANYDTEADALNSSREGYYYYLRDKFNKRDSTPRDMAAIFILMNKLCFRGVCRYSGAGQFNVPYGNPKIEVGVYSDDNLRECSRLFQRVNFQCRDFSDALEQAARGDFIYLDPPYINNDTEAGTQNFVGYVANGFTQHDDLFNKLNGLPDGVCWIMSNAHNEKLRTSFPQCTVEALNVRRAINSKDPASQSREMLVIKVPR